MLQFKEGTEAVRKLGRKLFPERQFYLRANGVVRYLAVSASAQMAAAALSVAVFLWLCVATFNTLHRDQYLVDKEQSLREITASYSTLRNQLLHVQTNILSATEKLEKRQLYLQHLLSNEERRAIADKVKDGAAPPRPAQEGAVVFPLTNSETSPRPTIFSRLMSGFGNSFTTSAYAQTGAASSAQAHSVLQIKQRLAAIQAHQWEIARALLDRTTKRFGDVEKAIHAVGLMKNDFINAADAVADETDAAGTDEPFGQALYNDPAGNMSLDDPVYKLVQQQQRLVSFAAVFDSMPVMVPVRSYYISSPFGARTDPFHGNAARHMGVDLSGERGSPVQSSAAGVVTDAGLNGAYGRFIEIDHGNGFKTRYGHLKSILVRPGQKVVQGKEIGLMGSSGRSTGTHLHYEIWFAGQPLNPVKFFKAADDVLKVRKDLNIYQS